MVNALDCGSVVCEFELQSRYYVYFRTNILPAMGWIVPLLSFSKDRFGIK